MDRPYGNSTSDPTPRGFVQTVLPNPEDMLSDPCITITAQNTNQYIEILLETATLGGNSRVCVTVNDNPEPACGNGQVSYCNTIPSVNLTAKIFCDDSCDLSDTVFWVRVNLSEPVDFDDEHWCERRQGDYPSGLIRVVTPPGITNPTEALSAGSLVSPSSLLLFLLMAIAVSFYAKL